MFYILINHSNISKSFPNFISLFFKFSLGFAFHVMQSFRPVFLSHRKLGNSSLCFSSIVISFLWFSLDSIFYIFKVDVLAEICLGA